MIGISSILGVLLRLRLRLSRMRSTYESFALYISRGIGESNYHSIEILTHDDLTSQTTCFG